MGFGMDNAQAAGMRTMKVTKWCEDESQSCCNRNSRTLGAAEGPDIGEKLPCRPQGQTLSGNDPASIRIPHLTIGASGAELCMPTEMVRAVGTRRGSSLNRYLCPRHSISA